MNRVMYVLMLCLYHLFVILWRVWILAADTIPGIMCCMCSAYPVRRVYTLALWDGCRWKEFLGVWLLEPCP